MAAASAAGVLTLAGAGVISKSYATTSPKQMSRDTSVELLPPSGIYIAPASESNLQIFSGSGNPALAQEICARLGVQLGRVTVGKFSDGETRIQVHDNVRGKDVYIIQPTCKPVNDNLMELLLLVSTMRRASANRVIAVMPYVGYARQDETHNHRSTIAGADVALMLESVGVDQVVAVDLHKGQMQGFFSASVPVENLDPLQSAVPYFLTKDLVSPAVVSPSGNGVHRANVFRDHLQKRGVDSGLAFLYAHNSHGFVDPDNIHHHRLRFPMEVVGDVQGRDCIVIDDMIDTGSRISQAAEALRKAGARRIWALCTHGLLTGNAVAKLNNSSLHEIVIFNTIPLSQEKWSPLIRQLSVGGLLSECIRRLHLKQSLSPLY